METARSSRRRRGAARGSALVVALWVISLLSLFVLTFAFEARIETRITSYYRKRAKAEHLARSGLEIAEMLMQRSSAMRKQPDAEPEEDDPWAEPAQRLADGLAIDGLRTPLGEGEIVLAIGPEPARRNVNTLRDDDWERLLERAGLPEERWPECVDSYEDWLDADDSPRADGAETDDYYAQLDKPYRALNGPLTTVDELLLVRGFTPALLYGGPLEADGARLRTDEAAPVLRGLAPLLTTYGDGKVNVNAASIDVLMTLAGIDEVVAGYLIEEREGLTGTAAGTGAGAGRENTPFRSIDDLYRRVPELPAVLRNVLTVDSTIYRVRSEGVVHGVRRTLQSVVEYAGGRVRILRWQEDE